jgi:transposase, IS30 family
VLIRAEPRYLRADLHQRLSTKRWAGKPGGRAAHRGVYSSGEEFVISDRPAEADDRAVPGHWEGDLIVGPNNSAIGTLVERTTRFTMLLHLPNDHSAETVATAMIEAMAELPEDLRRSITWDQAARWPLGPGPHAARRPGVFLQPTLTLAARH